MMQEWIDPPYVVTTVVVCVVCVFITLTIKAVADWLPIRPVVCWIGEIALDS